MAHKKHISVDQHEVAKKHCVKYLLEEAPLIHNILGCDYIVYPEDISAALEATHQLSPPEVKQSISWLPIRHKARQLDLENVVIGTCPIRR